MTGEARGALSAAVRALCLWLVLLACTCCCAAGQAAEKKPPPPKLPVPLLVGYGLDDVRDVARYADAGFNCAYIEVSDEQFKLSRRWLKSLLDACAKHKLPAIVGFKPLTDQRGNTVPASPRDLDYRRAAQDLILDVVDYIGDHPALAAWATPRSLEKHISYTEDDFREFLAAQYGDLQALARAWDTEFALWRQVTFAKARAVDDLKYLGVGRSTLDIAQYQATSLRETIDLWASTLNRVDGRHPVFAGEQRLYRSLACLPPSVAGVFVGIYPGEAEPDPLAQNVHAVDIARHGGRYRVIFGLGLARELDEGKLKRWALEALLHGAKGIAFRNWRDLAGQPALARALAETLDKARRSGLAEFQPAPSVAVLYEPFAEGLVLPDGTPAYGFLRQFCRGEPNGLMYALRLGHRYGQVDYVMPGELAPAIDRYGTIFALQTVDLPEAVAQAILGYVSRGGVFVGDLGLGMYESGTVSLFTPTLRRLLGILRIARVMTTSQNMFVRAQLPPFLSIPVGARTVSGPRGFAFDGPVGYAQLTMGARPWGQLSVARLGDGTLVQAGISINRIGAGYAVFCTARLFATWGPSDPLWERFMDDLLRRRALVVNVGQKRLLAEDVAVAAGADGSIAALNRGEWQAELTLLAQGPPGTLRTRCWTALGQSGPGSPAQATLRALVPPLSVVYMRAVPVQLSGEPCLARVRRYDEKTIELELRGPEAELKPQGEELIAGPARAVSETITVRSGKYQLKPDSAHEVLVLRAGENTELARLTVKANKQGEIAIRGAFRDAIVRISPAEQ